MFLAKIMGTPMKLLQAGQKLSAGSQKGEHRLDSDLPDEVVFDLMNNEMNELYGKDTESKGKDIIMISKKDPRVAVVRGTNSMSDVKSDIMGFFGKYDNEFEMNVNKIRKFLEDNPEIEHIVAHSLGGALAAEAIKGNPNVKTVGVDAARVLNKGDLKHVRNINTNSMFDMKLDPYNEAEKNFPVTTYIKRGLTPGQRAGHRAEYFKYRKKFQKSGPGKRSGHADSIVRFRSNSQIS